MNQKWDSMWKIPEFSFNLKLLEKSDIQTASAKIVNFFTPRAHCYCAYCIREVVMSQLFLIYIYRDRTGCVIFLQSVLRYLWDGECWLHVKLIISERVWAKPTLYDKCHAHNRFLTWIGAVWIKSDLIPNQQDNSSTVSNSYKQFI